MPRARKSLVRAAFPLASVLAAAGLAVSGTLTQAAAVPMVPSAPFQGPVKWSSEMGPVPHALTNTAPALTVASITGQTLLFWTGPSQGKNGFEISYQTAISLAKNRWSAPDLVNDGKAVTRSRLSAAPFGTTASRQVIVVWKDANSAQILYSVGQAGKGNALSWSPISPIPGATTSAGPSVYRPHNSDVILVTWKAVKGHAVDDIVGFGTPAGGLRWGQVGVIPRAATTGTPAIGEVSTATGRGLVYVFWTGLGTAGPVDFTTTPDPVSGSPKWTVPRALPASVKSGAAPSAQALGKSASYPLLVVFRALRGSALRYVTLAKSGRVAGPFGVPHLRSLNGTAISPGVLAAEAPDPGEIFYVRPCAGC
jgi:hypothetical protein